MKSKILLDFYADGNEADITQCVSLYAKRFGIEGRILELTGIGGWPRVRFAGTLHRLSSMLQSYASGPDELGDLLNQIVKIS